MTTLCQDKPATGVLNGKFKPRTCQCCRSEYTPNRANQKYCDEKCKKRKWDADHVKTFWSEDRKTKMIVITK